GWPRCLRSNSRWTRNSKNQILLVPKLRRLKQLRSRSRVQPLTIPDHRKVIDKLDTQIVRLLNERTKHILAIGEIKLRAGEEIYAPQRERAVLQRICRRNQGPMTNESLRAVYREIMSSALSLEKSMTIAYLGPEATFTHQAAIRRF